MHIGEVYCITEVGSTDKLSTMTYIVHLH